MSKINKFNMNNLIISALIFIGILLVAVIVTLPLQTNAWNGYSQESEGIFHTYNSASNSYPGNVVVSGNSSVQNPVPVITSLNPSIIAYKSGGRAITITGENFIPSSVARINNSDRPTTYASSTSLVVRLNSSDSSKLGDNLITVRNPGPGGGFSNIAILEVSKNVDASGSIINDDNGSVLGASAVGSGFMPSTFLQWLFLAILILFILILWRKTFAKKNEKTPLKHA